MKNVYIGEILRNEEIAQDCFLMRVALHVSFIDPRPGQFVMLRVSGLAEPLLSRPFSVCSFERQNRSCSLDLFYHVIGRGTQILAGLLKGTQVEMLGPLGRGFEVAGHKKNIVLLGGGMGMAPLIYLAMQLNKDACSSSSAMYFYLGAQNAEAVIGLEQLKKLSFTIFTCTDDGSMGEKGLVTQIFLKDLKKFVPGETMIYACGPKPMLSALAKILQKTKYPCQVSLEERMACGIGACLGCAVAVKRSKKSSLAYKRVCADGPVFDINEIVWK